jgi:hypothetical protein
VVEALPLLSPKKNLQEAQSSALRGDILVAARQIAAAKVREGAVRGYQAVVKFDDLCLRKKATSSYATFAA